MDKTHNISLGGFSFLIEDKAYQELSKYLNEVRKSLGNTSDTDEIIYDVEQRMAELLKAEMKGREVVVSQDVAYLIGVLGRPEQYVDEDAKKASDTGFSKQAESAFQRINAHIRSRKLYRDIEGKKIGGVLSGLSYYLNFDVTTLRIIYLVLLFLTQLPFIFTKPYYVFVGFIFVGISGFWILIYIVFWMLVPPARTTSEKLEMQGKSVTIDTLSTSKNFDYSTEKKLYRSSQNRMLGGVLSGLSEYYSLQTTWVRIIFVIALLGLIPLLNISFLLLVGYIVLWIIVPEKPVFFEERSNHFDENHSSKSENDFVKDTKIDEKETKQTSDKSDKVDENPITVNKKTSRIKQTRQGCWGFIRAIFKGILYVIVGFVVLILLFVFLSLFLVLLGVNVAFLGVAGVLATMYDYLPFLFNGSWQLPAVYIALGMLLFVAICVPTLVCIRLFSSTGKNISKNWVIANVLLFFIGTIMILVVIGNTARDFRYHRSVSKSIPLENISDTLKINMESMDNYGGAWNLYVQDDGKAIIEDNNWVEIKRTKGTPFLEIWTSSQGANGIEAKQNAEKIDYPLEISGNTISIPKYYILDKNSKFRMQKVTFLLNIPDNVILTTDSNMDTFFEGNYYWLKKDNHYRIHNDSLVNTATNLKEDNKRKEIRFHSRGRWHKQRVD